MKRTSESPGSKEVVSDLKFPGAFDARHSRRVRRAHSALSAAAPSCIDLENDEKRKTGMKGERDRGTEGGKRNVRGLF